MEAAIKKQRATAGYIERFWDNLIKAGRDKMTRAYMTARLELLESYWAKFFDAHDSLVICDKIDQTDYMKEDVYGLIEEHYLSTKSRIIAHLQTTKSMETTSTNADAGSVLRQIQLPKINLPTFDGDPLAWEGFRDLFKSLVHEVDGLAPIQKLQYLKASLAGEAAAVVSSIEMSAEGYALAWDELVSRFDNRRVLLTTHMRELLLSAPIVKQSSQEINRLISTANQSSRSFRALGRPVEHWDDWFVHIIVDKLDSSTRLLWESSQESSSNFPSFTELKTFLLTRARALEAAHPRSTAITSETKGGKRNGRKTDVSSHSSSTREGSQCPLCKARHPLRSCDKFKTFSVEQRRDQARRSKACFNCLGHNHAAAACPSINRCRHCREKHHSLLHIGVIQSAAPTIPQDSNAAITSLEKSVHQADATAVAALASTTNNTVLLATAMIKLISHSGRTVKVRALLDSGSEASFVSERVAQQLQLRRRRVNVTVSGLQGVTTGRVTHAVSLMIGSELSSTLRIAIPTALVMSKLTPFTPGKQVHKGHWPHLRGIQLADPNYDKPASVDAVLGADVYGMLIESGVKHGQPGEPYAHSTVFGWVLMSAIGHTNYPPGIDIASHHVTIEQDLRQQLQRFWELEEVSGECPLTPDEAYCERLFATTHTRDSDGRYVVRLPRKQEPSLELGDSRCGALRLLLAAESRLRRNPSLYQSYVEFLNDYSELGHMEPVPEAEIKGNGSYYLPHHAVVKTADPSGKIRVVFNASFRTSTGASLNDLLLPGPKLQAELWLILTSVTWSF
ncbi:uncharacterized protein LOC114937263 [Nylanderia fulva]|uniref:uncharacterized protein LOC114937263 n=1 Tax=Nylanderia fulva TaxID=613905 RepID=UPI0010FB53CC|nr:uncharacterized protein LOC114937263 [Nylanderia fulva]